MMADQNVGVEVYAIGGVITTTAFRARRWFNEQHGVLWGEIATDILSFGALSMITLGVSEIAKLGPYTTGMCGVGVTLIGLDAIRSLSATALSLWVKKKIGGDETPLDPPADEQKGETP